MAALSLSLPAVSMAQQRDVTAGTGDVLQEVVVTAERREETVQKIPISITAVTGEQLQARGITRLEDLAAETPGISMKQFAPGQTEYEMRGLPSSGGSSATVGLYVNDVPLAASVNSFMGRDELVVMVEEACQASGYRVGGYAIISHEPYNSRSKEVAGARSPHSGAGREY